MIDRGNLSIASRTLVTLAAFVVVVAGMRAAEPILTPFLLSLFVAVVAAPPMFWLQQRGMPTTLAMLIVLFLLVAVGSILVLLVGNSANDLISQLPLYQEKLKGYLDGVLAFLERLGLSVSRELILQYMNPGKVLGIFASTLSGLGGALTNAVLILFTVVFLLIEANGFGAKLHGALKEPDKSYPRFQRFADDLRRYLVIKAWVSAVTAVMILIPLLLIGLAYPWLWAALMFLLNYIPNIGPRAGGHAAFRAVDDGGEDRARKQR
ncbi:MAG: AI-2E family transporter [Gammaproteobacteria bacterium]